MNDRTSPDVAPSSEAKQLRVLLLARDEGAVGALLAADANLVVTAVSSWSEAEGSAARALPDVVVIALGVTTSKDPDDLRVFRRARSAVPVLVISAPAPERIVTDLIKAGASGYLFSDEARYARTAVREVARGGAPMSLPVSRIVLGRARRSSGTLPAVESPIPAAAARLTARQLEILELLAGGHSYDDIGLALDLSVNTVRSHVKALYERLGASTKVEAVMIGMELRLLKESTLKKEPDGGGSNRDGR